MVPVPFLRARPDSPSRPHVAFGHQDTATLQEAARFGACVCSVRFLLPLFVLSLFNGGVAEYITADTLLRVLWTARALAAAERRGYDCGYDYGSSDDGNIYQYDGTELQNTVRPAAERCALDA